MKICYQFNIFYLLEFRTPKRQATEPSYYLIVRLFVCRDILLSRVSVIYDIKLMHVIYLALRSAGPSCEPEPDCMHIIPSNRGIDTIELKLNIL